MKYHYIWSGKEKEILGVKYREVSELPGIFVSDIGRIITKGRPDGAYPGSDSGRGYRFIKSRGRTVYVHTLVYELFVERIPDGMEIDHINTIRFDNRCDNLRVVTRRDNLYGNPITSKRIRSKLHIAHEVATKAKYKAVVGTRSDGTQIGPFKSIDDAAEFVSVTASNISSVLHGRRRVSGGCTWSFVGEGVSK